MKNTYRVADYIADYLSRNQYNKAYCVPGESYLSLLDALFAKDIDVITCRHEASAGNMAVAYGKLSGKAGVAMVTRGPGLSHALISIHTAKQDSVPMVVFVGDIDKSYDGREAFQEIDYKTSFATIAKKVIRIEEAQRCHELIHQAFSLAENGRPGPVMVILPENILAHKTNKNIFKQTKIINNVDKLVCQKIGQKLKDARSPLLIVGGSAWSQQCKDLLENICDKINIPVALSFRCKDYMANDHKNYLGDLGFRANPQLISFIKQCDVVVFLGIRMSEVESQSYTLFDIPYNQQNIIHIYPDPFELGHIYHADIAVCSQSLDFLKALQSEVAKKPFSCNNSNGSATARINYEEFSNPDSFRVDKGVNLAKVMKIIQATTNNKAIFCNGAGNYAIWSHRFLRHNSFPSLLAPQSGAMGFGLPAAIAASDLIKNKTVICFAGDGCFMMAVNDLTTLDNLGCKVIIIVINNQGFGTIRMHQERDFAKRTIATDLHNPDFIKLAEAHNIKALRISTNSEFEQNWQNSWQSKKSILLELQTSINEIAPGKKID